MNNKRKVITNTKMRNIQVTDEVWTEAKLNAVKAHTTLVTYIDVVLRKALGLSLPPYSDEILGVTVTN